MSAHTCTPGPKGQPSFSMSCCACMDEADAALANDPGPIDDRPRRAKIRISPPEIARLLDIPEGLSVRFVYAEQDPTAIVVLVEGKSLEPVEWDTYSPYLNGHWAPTVLPDPAGGRPFARWNWERE